MSFEVWDTILRKYVIPFRNYQSRVYGASNPNVCPETLICHKDGEILLHKRAADMIKHASDLLPDIKIDVYSHGLMLPKWRDRGKDFIGFLASLPNRSRYLMSYHPFNHDGSTNDYAETTAYMKNVLSNPPPNIEFITVSHVSHYVTKEELQKWVDMWHPEIERRVLTVHSNVSINPWTGRIDEPDTVEFHGCPYGDFGHMFFGVTGNVIACCLDLEEEIIFGNVMVDEPARMIETLEAFYADQRNKVVTHSVCNNCHGIPQTPERLHQLSLAKV